LLGRWLDYLDNRPFVAVVYRRRRNIVNLFIFPTDRTGDTLPVKQRRAGYNIVDWTKSGMMYWMISSLNAAELQKFVRLVREENPAVSEPAR
jgi:anti-sigma factor RsiW